MINHSMPAMDQHLLKRIQPVLKRINRVRFWSAIALAWLVTATVVFALLISNLSGGIYYPSRVLIPVLIGLGLSLTLVATIWYRLTRCTGEQAAQLIEQQFAGLDSRLITAIEQRPDPQTGLYSFLQYDLIRHAVYHSFQAPWHKTVPNWRLFSASFAAVSSIVAFIVLITAYGWFARPLLNDPRVLDFNQVASGSQNYDLLVEPGDAEVEVGTSLMVLARFAEHLPPEAVLEYEPSNSTADPPEEISIRMRKSLADPVFGARIPQILSPLAYRIRYGNLSSETYRVTTFQYPQLIRADAEFVFPSFTRLANKVVQDVRRISAVAGTDLTLKCFLNKPVAHAQFRSREGDVIDLIAGAEPNVYQATLNLQNSMTLQLVLEDVEGRSNKSRAQITINVQQNRAPDLKWVQPGSDLQVSALEEVQTRATAWDDFGLLRVGFAYSIGGQSPQEIVLGRDFEAKQQHALQYLLSLEELAARPDDLITYHYWAEDLIGEDVVRRTYSDLLFAEVRHFEDIFRQGQAPPGGQPQQPQEQQSGQAGQNAQQAEQLAELQKQIINATWRVIRSETGASPSSRFNEDLQTILESQQAALEQLVGLSEMLTDSSTQALAHQAGDFMKQAVEQLRRAKSTESVMPLDEALSAEQQAYQGLLRLRARESEVAQMQQNQMQQPPGGQQGSRSQQQLQQLQLQQDTNRYEQERLAQPEQNPEQQEDRQILSRLRELARRQGDLNERIKELQSALDEADGENEREEIRRELKRLQEEQEQILRDSEELQERMNQEQNQQRMSEENQQLEEARENIRRANEALQEGELTQAAAEGTRAEREIRELRDEFQQRTSSQFTDEMRNMRDQAQELAHEQQRIGEAMRELERNRRSTSHSLSEPDPRDALAEQLAQQQTQVEQLRESMRETVESAEPYEPLLAEQLYDTYRQSEQDRPTQALESAESWLRRGFDDDAQYEEQRARESIERMRDGIDQASEQVLGDETEALRRANQELERLAREISDEAAQQGGDRAGNQEQDQADDQNQRRGAPGDEGDREQATSAERGEPTDNDETTGQGDRDGKSTDRNDDEQPVTEQTAGGQPSQPGDSDSESAGRRSGQDPEGERRDPSAERSGLRRLDDSDQEQQQLGDAGGFGADQRDPIPSSASRPLTGDNFLDWADRLRDVEEMVPDSRMRAEATRIREAAREFRQELKSHSREPNWELVRLRVIQPLVELQTQVADELIRRSAKDQIVPVDRDPVPIQYEEAVRKYYERLGTGQ